MIHPVFKLLISDPGLLAEHASAYAELAQAEASDAALALRRQALLLGAAALAALIALIGAMVAALLAAALPLQGMPAPWLLAALPATGLALAGALALQARSPERATRFALLRAQWREDLRLLQAASE